MTLRKLFLFSLTFLALPARLAIAHGENKPGPNGGYLRMPGAFHTELVSKNDQTFSVYLLDIQFQNPDVKQSRVSVTAKAKGSETPLRCETRSNYFLCTVTETKDKPAKFDQLVVNAKYRNFPEGTAIYSLPLKFEGATH